MQDPQTTSVEFTHLRLLSSGKFGRSWLVRSPNQELLLKKELFKTLPNEEGLQTLRQVKHPALLLPGKFSFLHQKTVVLRPWQEGSSLKDLLKQPRLWRRLSPEFWLKAFMHLCGGLEKLHAAGWLHGDIKPANILIRHNPEAKPSDWQAEQVCLIDFEQAHPFPDTNSKRRPFALAYAPPEQILQLPQLAAPSSDLFMLALCLYEALSGKGAFSYHDPEMLLHLQLNLPLPPHPRLPQSCLETLQKATAREAFPRPARQLERAAIEKLVSRGMALRYQSAPEFARALEALHNELHKRQKGWLATLFKHF